MEAAEDAKGALADVEAAPPAPEAPAAVSFREVLRTADAADVALMVAGSICGAACGSVQPCFTLIFGSLVDTLGSGTSMSESLKPVILWFCYLGAAATVAGYMEIACWELAGMRQANRIRRQYLTALLRQEMAFFDTHDSGALLARVVTDTNAIQEALSSKCPNLIHHGSAGVIGIIIGLARGWQMALVVCATLPLMGGAGYVMAMSMQYWKKIESDAYADASAFAKEIISQMRVVASFGGESRALASYTKALARPTDAAMQQARWAGAALGIVFLAMFGTYGFALWYGTTLLLAGKYTGGQVMNVLFAVIIGGFESGQATPNLSAINTAQVAAAAAFAIIDRVPAIDQAPPEEGEAAAKAEPISGEIELREVIFAYPTRPSVRVMDGTSLTIPAGKSMALVGSSGSGKSTIIQIIQRFYDPQQGAVLLDGTDMRSLNLRWVRRHMGLVSQEPALFSGSIRQNIAYGRDDATAEEIEAAAAAANAATFIGQLPLGYDTQTGERGVQLSGGQKQRVAIARAILRNPRILLLDEATSALDSESERVVQDALDKLIAAGGRTSIIIAHRLSTIRDADCITVLSKGAVVQQGTHAAMSADAGGAYAALLNAQQGQHFDEAGAGEDAAAAEDSAPGGAAALTRKQSLDASATRRKSLDGKPLDAADVVHAAAGVDADAPPAEEVKVPFSRLWALGKNRSGLLPLGVLGSMVNGAIMPCFALALASIIAAFFMPPAELEKEVHMWCLIFLGIAVGAFIAMVLQIWALGVIAAELALNARREVFAAIVRMEASWFDAPENSSGRLATRLEEDTVNIRGAVSDNVAVAAQNLTVMAGGLAIAFAYSWQLTLVILATLPLLVGGAVVQMKMLMGGMSGDNAKMYADANQMLSDALSNVRTVAAYGLSHDMVGLYTRAQEGPGEQLRKRANINGFAFGFGQGMFVFLYALAFWYGGYLVDQGKVEPGAVFKTFFAVMFMGMGGAQASIAFPSLAKAGDAVKSVFATIDRPSLIDASSSEGATPEKVAGEIELRDVRFAYPSRPGVLVLASLRLTIPAGKSMALVGASGSGKSTIIQMLQRFYDPADGALLLDGADMRSLNLRWLRVQMGLVSQEPALFSTSIGENIAYGREGATQADIEEAAANANAAEFIRRLPLGYDTPCGERGVQLSGGQKQRVAIARAILRNPRILLLDEATSALDSESERVVQDALDKLIAAGGRTSIIIAHRLSTIRDADCITVMGKGSVLESGTHDALLGHAGGKYAQLFRMQRGHGSTDNLQMRALA